LKIPRGYDHRLADLLPLSVRCGFPPAPYFRDFFSAGHGIYEALSTAGAPLDSSFFEFGAKGGDIGFALAEVPGTIYHGIEPRKSFKVFASEVLSNVCEPCLYDTVPEALLPSDSVIIIRDEWIALGNAPLIKLEALRSHASPVFILETASLSCLGEKGLDGSFLRWSEYHRWLKTALAHRHLGATRIKVNDFYTLCAL